LNAAIRGFFDSQTSDEINLVPQGVLGLTFFIIQPLEEQNEKKHEALYGTIIKVK